MDWAKQEQIISDYNQRWGEMKSARTQFEADWDLSDSQIEARTFYDNYGKLMVNVPLEQNLIELDIWRELWWPVNFNIDPDWNKVDWDELQKAKYTLDYFLEQGNFYSELRQFTLENSSYWSAVFYCGNTYTATEEYELKKDIEDSEDLFYNNKNYKKIKKEKREFTPKHIPLRHFWIDDRAVYSWRIENARDCIMQENITKEELKARRWDNKYFMNIDKVWECTDTDPAYNQQPIDPSTVILHYYYRKEDKSYNIIANYTTLIFAGKYMYWHWELPFAMAQKYPRVNRIYWRWIPAKVRYIKAYKSQMLQNALDKVQMSSWINIWIGNNWEVDWELHTWSWEINVWRFTDSLQNVSQYQLDWNISSIVSILQIIDDFVIQDTWENIKAPYSSPAWTLWEVEIMEENKQIRQKWIEASKNLCYDRALTMALWNIAQYAPSLLMKETKIDWEITKRESPAIQIRDVEVVKQWKRTVFETSMWKYGYFDLKPWNISTGLRVKVTTNSTRTALKTLEKESFRTFTDELMKLAQIKPDILQWLSTQDLRELMKTIYWYSDKLSATTKKDELKQKSLEVINQIKSTLWLNTLDPNALQNEPNKEVVSNVQSSAMNTPTPAVQS